MVSLAFGALLILVSLRNAWRGSASRRWPQAPGRITRSFVLIGDDGEDGETYTPRIEYEYQVEGTNYRGTVLQQGRIGSWSRKRAERIIAPYSPGASVVVFFDERRPANAVLLPGTSWGNLAVALAGLVFLACAVLLWQPAK